MLQNRGKTCTWNWYLDIWIEVFHGFTGILVYSQGVSNSKGIDIHSLLSKSWDLSFCIMRSIKKCLQTMGRNNLWHSTISETLFEL